MQSSTELSQRLAHTRCTTATTRNTTTQAGTTHRSRQPISDRHIDTANGTLKDLWSLEFDEQLNSSVSCQFVYQFISMTTSTTILRLANGLLPLAQTIKRELDEPSEKPKRKRQRLDHLSQDEKLMRRKLKNRVAAQSARDRKKVKMQDLEDHVNQLLKERKMLLINNTEIKLKNEQLMRENEELRKRLGEAESDHQESSQLLSGPVSGAGSFESAALISVPQQQEQEPAPATDSPTKSAQRSMMPFLCLLMMMNLTQLLTCYRSVLNNSCSQQSMRKRPSRDSLQKPMVQWWGAHQNSWNPSKT